MPRIRKKTSKRGSTNQREKIKHKVSETRKKRKKESKKNPQWKSKHKKDPGIPNNFPYKDQILAEVAEQRRQAEEVKQLRKEQKKAAKAGAGVGDVEEDLASEGEESDVGGFDGVTALRASAAESSKQAKTAAEEIMDVEDMPVVVNSELASLKEVLEEVDVVIEVLDARDPMAYHSEHLAGLVKEKKGQKLLLVLNKIDTSPREAVSSWSTHLSSRFPTRIFRSASAFLPSIEPVPSKGKGKARADDAVGVDSIISLLGQSAEEKSGDKPLAVAVVGLTNSGKSSFIDSLLRKAALPVYQLGTSGDGPTTTIRAQEVMLEVGSKSVRLIDTPGYSWLANSEEPIDKSEGRRARDLLNRNKGRIERLKDTEPVVHDIVSRANQEDLMLFYNLPAFASNDTDAFLRALARASGLIKKGGALDTTGASRIVLRDWSTGKLPRYTIATGASSEAVVDNDATILSTLHTRKELRTSTGLIKLKASEVESRQLALDSVWTGSADSEVGDEGDEEDDEQEEDIEDDEDDEEGEEPETGEDEEDTTAPELLVNRRKRGGPVLTSQLTKKVAFSTEPKDTKQARKTAGARGSLSAKAKLEAAKPATKSKVAKTLPVPAKKAANTPSKKSAAAASSGGDETYDFKMFF
ncbi:P-loop containing nucleoside triphosphate hydrolase protein [Cytidiella melzeri]|nr:P-loop containing nucleoside triphosphate hydrolase protein [Cytidiella melzeri]